MASKLQEYRRMSEEAQRQLTGSLERWQSFLATASRLYKYPYHEQVMIHAQRPDATACAEFDVWNNTMRRYVRRGSKGIALIDTSGDRERLRYVFDVSDTGTRPNSRSLNLWELREEHIPTVSSMLEKNYGVPAGESLAAQLEAVASQLAREYWEDNRRDKQRKPDTLLHIVAINLSRCPSLHNAHVFPPCFVVSPTDFARCASYTVPVTLRRQRRRRNAPPTEHMEVYSWNTICFAISARRPPAAPVAPGLVSAEKRRTWRLCRTCWSTRLEVLPP